MTNLRREGHPEEHLHLVGNVMIDTLLRLLPKARLCDAPSRYGLQPGRYGVVTLHRPANVDQPQTLSAMLGVIAEASAELPLVFPVHPRTRRRIDGIRTRQCPRRRRGRRPAAAAGLPRLLVA